jgi:hypothetical protein
VTSTPQDADTDGRAADPDGSGRATGPVLAPIVQVTFDAAAPGRLAEFWQVALGYVFDDPPPGFESWPQALAAFGLPEERWDDASAIHDPAGARPRVFFQKVPEGKTAKNRVHLDVGVSQGLSPDQQWPAILAHVETLTRHGAMVVQERTNEGFGNRWMVMVDPEGNEFCVT